LPGGFISQNANEQISTFAIFQSCKFFRHSTPQIKVESEHCRKYSFSGRHSTPLHFAAGYNRVGVVEFLLNNGADVHAKDKVGFACVAIE